MLSIFISILISAVLVYTCISNQLSTGSTVASGIFGFIIPIVLISFIVRKKTAAINTALQEIMMTAQKRIKHKVQMFQSKPGGNPSLLQRQIEADQKVISQQALEFVDRFEPLKKWNLLMGKQITTMRLQFLYQLKEFKQVDDILAMRGLFSKPLLMEPLLVTMKMARQYKNKEIAAAEKTFKRHVIWFKGYRSTLLYGVMSWIYVKSGDVEKARQLLIKGKESTGNEVLSHNWEMLSNGKEKKFSNAGLGEEWYSLYLENPPAAKQQRIRAKGGRKF
jgi:hypothetical protein